MSSNLQKIKKKIHREKGKEKTVTDSFQKRKMYTHIIPLTKAISAQKRGEIKAYPIEIGKPSHGGIRRISLPTNMGRGGLLSLIILVSLFVYEFGRLYPPGDLS